MENPSVESERTYFDREAVLTAIREYGEQYAGERKADQEWTAERIAKRVGRLPTTKKGIIQFGTIKKTFVGHFMSMGRCSECGHILQWRTDQPPRGCPYCFMRVAEELKNGKKQNVQRRKAVSRNTDADQK